MTDLPQSQTERIEQGMTDSVDQSSGIKVMLFGTLLLMLLAIGYFVIQSGAGVSSGGSTVATLPVLGNVPEFSLVSHTAEPVGLSDLRGHVWVVDFIFTTCTGPCPMLTLRMRSLQGSLLKSGRDVRLVSITVDPETDTPAVMNRYMKKNKIDFSSWVFLTGEREAEIHNLIQEGFLQAVTPSGNGRPIIHSSSFILIDRQGRIRASYDGKDPASKARILRDVDQLLREKN